MPYKTGEEPRIGDRVKTTSGKNGTVREVQQGFGQMADDQLTIKWDDEVGAVDDYPANDFLLVSRPVNA